MPPAPASLQGALDTASSVADWVWEHILSPEPITFCVLASVLFVRRFSGWFSRQPVRRAARRVRKQAEDVRATRKALEGWLAQNLRSGETLDVAAVAQSICAPGGGPDGGATAPAFDSTGFRILVDLCRHALEPGTPGLVVRYIVSGAWEEHRELLARLARYLDQFDTLRPVRAPGPYPIGTTFAEGVSVLSGAVVEVDFTSGSARAADRVAVWHTGAWTGRPVPDGSQGSTPFLQALEADSDGAEVGRYNGRVPTLVRAEVRQRPGSDGAVLVLTTAESDYASTEPRPSGDRRTATPYQCKKLAPARSDEHLRTLVRLPDRVGGRHLGAYIAPGAGRRTVLLNVKVGLISFHDGAPHLVLMRRTDWVSNAAGVIAPTAGGVVELAVPGDQRDGDGLGSVDFLAGARREVAEELGLRPDEYNLAAHAVYLANNRPRPLDGADPATGELTATVLALGMTNLGPTDFVRARAWASPGTGLFESHGVHFVPMGADAGAFARNLTEGGFTPDGRWFGPGSGPARVRRLDDWIDQSSLVTALYASALVHGPQATLRAFRDAAAGRPWWAREWPEGSPEPRLRICRNPGRLMGDVAAFKDMCTRIGLEDVEGLLAPLTEDPEDGSDG